MALRSAAGVNRRSTSVGTASSRPHIQSLARHCGRRNAAKLASSLPASLTSTGMPCGPDTTGGRDDETGGVQVRCCSAAAARSAANRSASGVRPAADRRTKSIRRWPGAPATNSGKQTTSRAASAARSIGAGASTASSRAPSPVAATAGARGSDRRRSAYGTRTSAASTSRRSTAPSSGGPPPSRRALTMVSTASSSVGSSPPSGPRACTSRSASARLIFSSPPSTFDVAAIHAATQLPGVARVLVVGRCDRQVQPAEPAGPLERGVDEARHSIEPGLDLAGLGRGILDEARPLEEQLRDTGERSDAGSGTRRRSRPSRTRARPGDRHRARCAPRTPW